MTSEARDNLLIRFIRETRSELRKVVWPSRQDALRMSSVVIGVTLGMAAGLAIVDLFFSRLLSLILR